MNYLARKKRAFMPILTKIKGFIRIISGQMPIVVTNCVDEDSILDYTVFAGIGGLGDKTENLFDESQLLRATQWNCDENGVYSGTISNLWGRFNYSGNFDIPVPEDAKQIYISYEAKNQMETRPTFSINIFYKDGSSTLWKGMVQSTDWKKYEVKTDYGKKISEIKCGYSYSDTIYLKNIMVSADKKVDYEPFGKYKITLNATGDVGQEERTKIYIDAPLEYGDALNMKRDNLPKLPAFHGDTCYDMESDSKTGGMSVTYYAYSKR